MATAPQAPSAPTDPVPKPSHSRFAFLHPRAYLGVYGLVGLAIAAACSWAFFAIADEFPEHGWMTGLDNGVTDWLQVHGTETGESIFSGVSLLGSDVLIAVLIIAAIALAWRRNWRRLAALAITCGGGALLNGALKLSFHRARPSFASEFNVRSWSFPSGHAMDSLIVYGFLAHWLMSRLPRWRTPIVVFTIVLVGVIGYARIYLGVHYLSDVLAGYCAGFVWLMVCISGFRFAERRHIGRGAPSE